ncbi:MAG: glycosyltransferase family 4 protein [Ferruginibacter sp.]
MRIAFITYEYPPDTGKGGIGTYTFQVSTVLVKNGGDVHVFAGSNHRQCEVSENGIKIHWIHCSGPHDFAEKVFPVFQSENAICAFDIMESAEIHGNAIQVKRNFPEIPLVVRLHAPNWLVENLKKRYVPFIAKLRYVAGALKRGKWDTGYWSKYKIGNDKDYQFCLLADAISAPSGIMKKWAVKNWKMDPDKIKVIANPFLTPAAFLEIPVSRIPEHKTIVFFGRLNVLKGMVNASIAMRKILVEFPDYKFLVIGDDGTGPDGQSMKDWMNRKLKKTGDRVHFLDGMAYDEMPAAIAKSEIALLPSLFESFSYTCAEAMAAGKAVIGSINTGMEDMITHKKNGMLIDPESAVSIYQALKELIQNNELLYEIRTNARQNWMEYKEAKLANSYIDFYKSVISE